MKLKELITNNYMELIGYIGETWRIELDREYYPEDKGSKFCESYHLFADADDDEEIGEYCREEIEEIIKDLQNYLNIIDSEVQVINNPNKPKINAPGSLKASD